MRTKSFILTFLMMMFCSIGFGQSGTGNHWNPDEHQYANNMDVIAIIEIDDVEQKTESLEVGAFCGTELRASSRPMKAPMLENRYIVFLDILGDEDDDLITFKLYDHSQGIELNYVIEKPINFRFGQDPLGSVDAPYVLEFLTPVAKIGDVHYRTLPLAVEAATAGQTVELIADATGAGVVIDKNITVDFGGKTYTINQAVGSAGTETLGFQILRNNTVTLMNGTLTSTTPVVAGKEVKMLIQNYANLTLTDMNLVDDTDHIQYVLSNNSGTSNINGATNITTDAVAFDVYDYSSAGGYAVPEVNVNTTGIIDGKIEVSESISNNLNISGGKFTKELQLTWCAEGYVPVKDGEYWTVVKGAIEVTYENGSVAYFSRMIDAVPYNNNTALKNATIKLLNNCEGEGMRFWQNG